jgi:hypothetical protein
LKKKNISAVEENYGIHAWIMPFHSKYSLGGCRKK